MPLNKVQLTINSRMYTVVSDETPEYIEMLGEHINEKVLAVINEGRHIMGERPLVLAALNICDEYYKLAAEKSKIDMSEISAIKSENESLKNTIAAIENENNELIAENEKLRADHTAAIEAEAVSKNIKMQNELNEAQTQIKFLESKINELEEKNVKMKQDHERREQEIFDMFDNKNSSNKHNKNKR